MSTELEIGGDEPRYRAGEWHGLVVEGALALLHPDVSPSVAAELWLLAAEGKRLSSWVEYLAGAGIRTLPSFAMVERHAGGARVLVRGEIDVVMGERVISGRDYATWREEVVVDPGVVELRSREGDTLWWPIRAGVVAACQVRARLSGDAGPLGDEEDEEDVELTVARMPAIAAALRGSAAGAVTEHGAEEAAEVLASPELATDDDSHDGEYDHLLWSTEQQAQRPPTSSSPDTTPEPAAALEPAEAAADLEATREPEPDSEQPEHGSERAGNSPWQPPPIVDSRPSGAAANEVQRAAAEGEGEGGIIDSIPPWLRPASAVPATAPPAAAEPVRPPAPPATTEAESLPPPAGLPVDLPAPVEPEAHATVLREDLPPSEVSPDAPPASPAEQPVRYTLVVSTGQRVELDRPILVGRAPQAERFAGDIAPRLVRVANPQKDISATHVELRPAGDHVVVTDMNSTNGTVVHHANQHSIRLQPGTGVPLAPGASVDIGGITLMVELA